MDQNSTGNDLSKSNADIHNSTHEKGNQSRKNPTSAISVNIQLSSPRAKHAGPKGLRAESARAVTGRRCPHSGVGEDFLARRPGSPHENGCNSETKSRTIDPKVPKRNQRRGLRAPLCQKKGSHTKKTDFRAKIRIFGAKKKTYTFKA